MVNSYAQFRKWVLELILQLRLMPLSALVTPATLTVVATPTVSQEMTNVPMVNYTNTSSLFSYSNSNVGADINTVDNGISPFLSRLMAATASSLDIIPMAAVAVPGNYSLQFSAPSFRCITAPDNVTTVINKVASYASSLSTNWTIDFMAFTPQDEMLIDSGANYTHYQEFTNSCIGGTSSLNGTVFYCDGMAANYPGSSTLIWIMTLDEHYSCSLEDTHFSVTFNGSGAFQSILHPYDFEYTNQPPEDSYYVYGQVISNWLNGVLWGVDQGVVSARTRIMQTSIYAALKTNNQSLANQNGIAEAAIPPAEKALTRGLTVAQLIEELSRNLTLSFFSADRTWSASGIDTTVNWFLDGNYYSYNFATLALAYGLAIAATLFCLIIGIRAFILNGVSHATSFSAIMCSTRNAMLDDLTIGQSLAAEPKEKNLLDTKLRLGLLRQQGDEGLVRRVGFGLAGEVEELHKGDICM